MVYPVQLPQVSRVGLAPLAHGVGSVGASLLGAVKKIAGMTVKHCGVVPPLPSNDLIALQKQLMHQKTLPRILKRTFQFGYTQKQASRKQVAACVLDTAAKLGGYEISAPQLAKVVKASVGQELSTEGKKYVENLCIKLVQGPMSGQFSALWADYAWLRGDVRAVFDGFLAEYRSEQKIGHLSIDCIINDEKFDQDVLKVLNGQASFQLRDTPENQALAEKLNDDLLNRVASFKQKYGEEALQKFVRQEVSALSTLGSAKFDLALKHLVVKGPEWVKSNFLWQRNALMRDVKNTLPSLLNTLRDDPSSFTENTLTPAGLSSWLKEQLNLGNTEPWSQMPDYVDHLLAQPCLEALRSGPLSGLTGVYRELKQQVDVWHAELMRLPAPPVHLSDEQKGVAAFLLRSSVQANGIDVALFEQMIRTELEKPLGYRQLSYEDGPSLVQPHVDYFKANKKTLNAALPATRVRTASGKIYELLNTLSPEASQALHKQQGLTRSGKVVLGKGGFGKVRLARELGTENGNIVVVKKFAGNRYDPMKEADAERNKVKLVQDRAVLKGEAVSNTLASVLDYAHVKVPSRILPDQLVDKSYIFMPLLNGGDGNAAVRSLLHMRQNDPVNADVRFLHIAKGYAESVKNLHELGLHHRDIKLSNFMHTWVDGAKQGEKIEQLKLIDFGAVQLSENKHEKRIDGTYVYCPPEKFPQTAKENDPNYHADKHDAFSLGVSLLELRLGRFLPYTEGSTEPDRQAFTLKLKDKNGVEKQFILPLAVADYDQSGRWWRPLGIPTELLENFADDHIDNIIAKLLDVNPETRMTAAQAFEALKSVELRPVERTKPLSDGAGPSGQKTMRLADYLGWTLMDKAQTPK